MQISPGVRIGSFEIRAHIGAGGMGTVYRACDTNLRRDVAIKIVQDRFARSGEYLLRFKREARSASALNHPNIITVFEIDEVDGVPFIVMELIEGSRFRDLLRHGPVPLRKLLKLAAQVADGLAAAHDAGILHRDLKPENVMVTSHGVVKILDFGLARLSRSAEPDDTTSEVITDRAEHHFMGTAAYMSPEQASGSAVDFRSDQFSFGSMLYEMATGKSAFRRASNVETLHAVIHDEPEPIQRVNPKLPAPFCWIVERCLAKDPNDRYASTKDLARELQTLRDRLPETGPGDRPLPVPWIWTRRSALIGGTVVVAVALVLGTQSRVWDRVRPAPASLPDKRFVAVLPFKDVSGRPDAQLFSDGFAEAVSARLTKFPSIQVIPPTSSAPLLAKGADDRRIAQELGATLLLKATVRRNGDNLLIAYSIIDAARGATVANATVNGSADNIWTVQDELSDDIVRHLGIEQRQAPSQQAELETPEEQDLYLRALGHLQNQEDPQAVDSALSLLRELLETASGSPLVHAALGRTYLYKYQLTKDRVWSDKAIAASDRARALGPNSPEVLLTLATVQEFMGRFGDAIATFKRVLALQPNSPEAVIALAKSYKGALQIEDAERAFRRGIGLRPTWWYGYNELGVMYLANARYDEAAQQFKRVTELNPQSPWGYSNLGGVYINQQRLPEAITTLNKAVTLRESAAAYANLAYCYYYLGQYDKSAESYRKAAKLKPKLATHWASLADACRWTLCANEVDSSIAKAIELLKQELAVDPKNSRAHATLAVCLARSGRRAEAQEHIREALALEPKNPSRMFQAARVANFSGNPAEAVSWLRRALEAGQGELEIQRDPEFRELRQTDAFRAAFKKSSQRT